MKSKISAIATAVTLVITTLAGDSITNLEGRLYALGTFAQTNLLLALKNGDYKLVQCVSERLREQRKEALGGNRNEWGPENKMRVFKIGLSVLQAATSMHDWKVGPYDAYPDITRLNLELSKDAIYHDAKRTELQDISNPVVRAELERYRSEKKLLIARSQSEFVLHRIYEQKMRELRQEIQSVCKTNSESCQKGIDAIFEIVVDKEVRRKLLEGVKRDTQTVQENEGAIHGTDPFSPAPESADVTFIHPLQGAFLQ